MTASTSLNLIAVGDNCLDVYLNSNCMTVGGNALNVAAQWKLQGHAARYFGAVGHDNEGSVISAALSQLGLDAGDLEYRPGSTAITLLLERLGDRTFLLEDLGNGAHYIPDALRYDALQQADWVHLGTNSSPELVKHLVNDGIHFSVDVSTRHDDLPLEKVPLVFASGPEDANTPVEPVLRQLHDKGAQQVVVTCGSRGAFLLLDKDIIHSPAHTIEITDTCGAGDSFIARYLTHYVQNDVSPLQALQEATSAAAFTCSHQGGFPQPRLSIPAWLLDKYKKVIDSAEL